MFLAIHNQGFLWDIYQKVRLVSHRLCSLSSSLDITIEEENGWGNLPDSPRVKTSPSNAGSVSLIPGQGARILHAAKKPHLEQYCNKFSKDFKNGPH